MSSLSLFFLCWEMFLGNGKKKQKNWAIAWSNGHLRDGVLYSVLLLFLTSAMHHHQIAKQPRKMINKPRQASAKYIGGYGLDKRELSNSLLPHLTGIQTRLQLREALRNHPTRCTQSLWGPSFTGKTTLSKKRGVWGGQLNWGSWEYQLSIWPQSLHLRQGQITQRCPPTTSVWMTNSLQLGE